MDSENEPQREPRAIPYVAITGMTREVRDYICETTSVTHVWSDDWSPEYFRAQARLGFIAVAAPGPEGHGNVLIPELQADYAVLDWAELCVDRGVRRIMGDGHMEREEIRLEIGCDPECVLAQLEGVWRDETWLRPEYVDVVRTLATRAERDSDPGFRVMATMLMVGDEPAAGELGYAVGRVYVSLSGFFHRERPEWNHYGKLQMVLLARRLEAAGFGFWNLGHPYMDYKTRLGARIVPRGEFLPRWDDTARGDVPGLGE